MWYKKKLEKMNLNLQREENSTKVIRFSGVNGED